MLRWVEMEVETSRKRPDLVNLVDFIDLGGAWEHRKSYKMVKASSSEGICGGMILKMAFLR